METLSVTEQWDSLHDQVDKRYTEILVQLQGTLAIGDYEELLFKFLKAQANFKDIGWNFGKFLVNAEG